MPHVVHVVESNFSDIYTNQWVSMGITPDNTEMHGHILTIYAIDPLWI